MLGRYVPRDSPLHRLPAAVKLVAMLALVTFLAIFPRPVPLAVAALAVAALFPVARLGPVYLWRALRPALVFAAVLTAFYILSQGISDGARAAVGPVGQLVVGVLAGNLLVFTTRATDLAALAGRVLGWRVELLVALTIRSIPTVIAVVRQTREAAWARGQRASLIRVLPTVLIRLIRDADLLGEALAARGI
ncbi:energy-coupling factor transporter transmembrane component T family protein [Tsukamurella pulmonis]|uniref:energy-coupling factor transporter transmembrane component T family protein n=1 Tax=Tsukamurella pulmonis TaxID=47312 RepID=UPI000E092653|nr:energy-coupling factor transporter transmembrane protein EcfT [Tsukamurella pulmonis]RDH10951.1 energy-coupling factor transporter transmembrane protein EcfT [Tsukamurella pulmonis]